MTDKPIIPSDVEFDSSTSGVVSREDSNSMFTSSQSTFLSHDRGAAGLMNMQEKAENKTDEERYEQAVAQVEKECPQAREKWCHTLQYIVHAEESRETQDFFTEVREQADSDDKPLSDFRFDSDRDFSDNGVVLVSHQVDEAKALEVISPKGKDLFSVYEAKEGESKEDAPFWLRVPLLQASEGPEIPKNEQVQKDLEHLRKVRYKHTEDTKDMLSHLKVADLPPEAIGREATRAFLKDVLEHKLVVQCRKVHQALSSRHGNCSQASVEWVLGLGHASWVYDEDEKTLSVDGPLFEIMVEVKLDTKSKAILIRPRRNVPVKINQVVSAGIASDGNLNEDALESLHRLVKETDTNSILPGTPDTYYSLLEAALALRFNAFIKDSEHVPPGALVLSPAWCLYSRNKTRTHFSRDARNLETALTAKKINMTLPILGLMEGADALEGISLARNKKVSVHPLPTSARQLEVNKKIWEDGRSVVVVPGPPGCGKTHLNVSEIATALTQGNKVLFTSTNEAAQKAFVEKLPGPMKRLCLDMSGLKGNDLDGFRDAVEDLINELAKADANAPEYKTRVKELQEQLTTKKEERGQLREKLEETHRQKLGLINHTKSKSMLDLASSFTTNYACFVTAVMSQHQVVSWDKIHAQIDEFHEKRAHTISFGDKTVSVTDEMIQLATGKASNACKETEPIELWSDLSVSPAEELIESITIEGRKAKTPDDWSRIVCALKFKKDCIDPLINLGLLEKDIYSEDGSGLCNGFVHGIQQGKKLRELFLGTENDQELLRTCLSGPSDSQEVQDRDGSLSTEIQKLEEELVMVMVISSLNDTLDGNDRSKLLDLHTDLVKITASSLTDDSKKKQAPSNGKKKKSSSNGNSNMKQLIRKQFLAAFQDAAGSIPFLAMPIDYVSKYLPANHSFDFGVIDEASQSDYRSLLAAARCKQLLIVGDNQQTSPSGCGLSAERITQLENHLPNIARATRKRLLPAQSFFDLFTNTFSRSQYVVRLYEHFRCRPQIIQVANSVFYRNKLDPLREPSNNREVLIVRSDGNKDPSTKTNAKESEFIAAEIYKEVEGSLDSDKYRTIMAISMGGEKQRDQIKHDVEETLDKLQNERNIPSKLIKRHRILYAIPQQCQGDERDVVFISAVHGGEAVARKKKNHSKGTKGETNEKRLSNLKKEDLKDICRDKVNFKGNAKKPDLIDRILKAFKDREEELAGIIEAHLTTKKENESAGDGGKPSTGKTARQTISLEIKEADKKKWCVACSRAKEKMVLVHSFGKAELTNKNDIRIKIMEAFYDASNSGPVDPSIDLTAARCLRSKAELSLVSSLREAGYSISRRGGIALKDALCIRRVGATTSTTAIMWIENGGETEKEWKQMMDQQVSLERAKRLCLRVDCISVLINFSSTVKKLLDYLDAKLPVAPGEKRGSAYPASAPPAKMPRMEENSKPMSL